jgi:Outer membrane protein beta-barrel domain
MMLATIGVLVCWVGTDAAAARPLKLQTHRGTMTLGGQLAFEVDHFSGQGNNDLDGAVLAIQPSLGYFIVDNLLLGGHVNFSMGIGDLHDTDPTVVGFGADLRYLFNFGSVVVPYAGIGLGPLFQIPDEGDTDFGLELSFPLGLQIALNHHVALVVGTELDVVFFVSDPQYTRLHVPIGYLGVVGYF